MDARPTQKSVDSPVPSPIDCGQSGVLAKPPGLTRSEKGVYLMGVDSTRRPTVLVVEDFADNRQMLSMWLRQEGYEVLEAADGREAIDAASRERPDLVLMDLSLPGLDGLSAVYRMRELDSMSDVPVVACTAHSPGLHLRAARAVGCDEYLTKPVEFARLRELLARLLADGRGESKGGDAGVSIPRGSRRMNSEELTTYIDGLLSGDGSPA